MEEAIRTQGPSSLLRALERTRAPLTAFDDDAFFRFKREALVLATIPAGMVGADTGLHEK